MICNIVDRRKRQYRFVKIDACIEAAWHDDRCKDADKAPRRGDGPDYEEQLRVTLNSAIVWAERHPEWVTLYLYEPGALDRRAVLRARP